MSFNANMLSVGILGLFVFAALGTGLALVRHEVRAAGGDEDRILDLCFWLMLGAILGARLFDVVDRPAGTATDALEILRFWNGSSFYYGGAVAAAAAGWIFIQHNRLPLWKTSDYFGPALAFGHFLVYVGIFFSGQGLRESLGFSPALVIARPDGGLLGALPRPNPVAFYLACGSFFVFALVLIVKARRKFDGQVFWTFALLNGGLHLVLAVSVFSGRRMLHGGDPSPAAIINALLVLTSLAMLVKLRGQAQKRANAAARSLPP